VAETVRNLQVFNFCLQLIKYFLQKKRIKSLCNIIKCVARIPSKTFGTSSSKYTRLGKSGTPNSSATWKSWKYNYCNYMDKFCNSYSITVILSKINRLEILFMSEIMHIISKY
jgi:hypothetical protein